MKNSHKNTKGILIFQGIYNDKIEFWIEQLLPSYLSKYTKVYCFEYPQFNKLLKLLLGQIKLIDKKSENLIIFHSIGLLPFGRKFLFINYINHILNFFIFNLYICKIYKQGFKIITFTPELSLVSRWINYKKIIYYITDNYTALPSWKSKLQKKQFYYLEKKMMRIASTILVTSKSLFKKYKKVHDNTHLFLIPSRVQIYLNSIKLKLRIPNDITEISHPIAGYIGSIYDWKINLKLLQKVLKDFPNVSFVIVGTIDFKKIVKYHLSSFKNFFFLGLKNIHEIPPYVRVFDVCLVPYRINEYGKFAYPVKIMEYLACGKPVVSTALPSVENLARKKLIYWAKNHAEFIYYLNKALNERTSINRFQYRMKEAIKNDWEHRIVDLMKVINL